MCFTWSNFQEYSIGSCVWFAFFIHPYCLGKAHHMLRRSSISFTFWEERAHRMARFAGFQLWEKSITVSLFPARDRVFQMEASRSLIAQGTCALRFFSRAKRDTNFTPFTSALLWSLIASFGGWWSPDVCFEMQLGIMHIAMKSIECIVTIWWRRGRGSILTKLAQYGTYRFPRFAHFCYHLCEIILLIGIGSKCAH